MDIREGGDGGGQGRCCCGRVTLRAEGGGAAGDRFSNEIAKERRWEAAATHGM